MMRSFLILFIAALSMNCNGPETSTASIEHAEKPQTPKVVLLEAVEAENLIDSLPKLQIVDARTPREWEEGVLESAILIDYFNEQRDEDLKAKLNPDLPVLVYCRSGGRSAKTGELLLSMGFKEIYDLKGGVTVWKATGRALVEPQTDSQAQ